MDAPVFAPSDLQRLAGTARARVGGRVLERSKGRLTLADALGAIPVALVADDAAEPGDLIVVEGAPTPTGLSDARVLERFVPARPARRAAPADEPAGEHERLARGVGKGLAARALAIATLRAELAREAFLEVDTPAVVPSPGLDLHLDAFEVASAPWPAWLVTSPEYQMKRLLVGGVHRSFQVARCFRRGEVGSRHNPEFLMLEWYRAFAGVDEIMADTERLVRAVARALLGRELITTAEGPVELSAPFERLAVGEAFARFAGVPADEAIALASTDEERFFRLLVDAVEPALARSPRPVFLVDYPTPFASLARKKPSDPRVCERFELYVGGVEVCNGFGELTCPVEQRARLEHDQAERRARGLPVYPIDERFLAALEEGMPPSAGNAMGIDRLVALCTGAARIADVLAFPIGWL